MMNGMVNTKIAKINVENTRLPRIKAAISFASKEVFPLIHLSLHHNARYTNENFLNLLSYMATRHIFAHGGVGDYELETGSRSPKSNTLLYHIRNLKTNQIMQKFDRANDTIFSIARKNKILKPKEPVDLAVDLHDVPYYGDKTDKMVVGTKPTRGTCYAFQFGCVSIVEGGKRFIIHTQPRGHLMTPTDVAMKLIDYAIGCGFKINRVFLDRGFFGTEMFEFLEMRHLKYIMPAIRRKGRIMKMLVKENDGKILHHVMTGWSVLTTKRAFKAKTNMKVYVKEINKVVYGFFTNLTDEEIKKNEVALLYSKRGGIETAFRQLAHDFRAKTTSKKYPVRLFYFLFSVLLFNLWILVNAIARFAEKRKNPVVVPARRFGVILVFEGRRSQTA